MLSAGLANTLPLVGSVACQRLWCLAAATCALRRIAGLSAMVFRKRLAGMRFRVSVYPNLELSGLRWFGDWSRIYLMGVRLHFIVFSVAVGLVERVGSFGARASCALGPLRAVSLAWPRVSSGAWVCGFVELGEAPRWFPFRTLALWRFPRLGSFAILRSLAARSASRPCLIVFLVSLSSLFSVSSLAACLRSLTCCCAYRCQHVSHADMAQQCHLNVLFFAHPFWPLEVR
jgi:hypothetical protein